MFHKIGDRTVIDLSDVVFCSLEKSLKNDEINPGSWRIVICCKSLNDHYINVWCKRKTDAEFEFAILCNALQGLKK